LGGLFDSNRTDDRDVTKVVIVDGYNDTFNSPEVNSQGELSTVSRIAGATFTPDSRLKVDAEVTIDQIINNQGTPPSTLTVGTTSIEVKFGANRLVDRKLVVIHNSSNNTIYWGWDNTVTTSNGIPIFKNQTSFFEVGDQIGIWVIAPTAGNVVRVNESG